MLSYLLGEVLEQRHVAPAFQVDTLPLAQLLVLGLLRVLVQRAEEAFVEDKVLVVLFVVDFDVGVFGVDAEREVGGERPWRGGPSQKGCFPVVDEGKGDSDCE